MGVHGVMFTIPMRGNEWRGEPWPRHVLLLEFTIPMRGNETPGNAVTSPPRPFTIPMRGNEVQELSYQENSTFKFTIPMRGNEQARGIHVGQMARGSRSP